MKSFAFISNTFSKKKSAFVKPALTNPNRDWKIVIIITSILLVGAFSFSYYSFMTYNAIDQQSVDVSVDTIRYRGDQIREQVAEYERRKQNLSEVIAVNRVEVVPVATTTDSIASTTVVEELPAVSSSEGNAPLQFQ